MNYCTGCGKPLDPGAKFCSTCGASVPLAGTGTPLSDDSVPVAGGAPTAAAFAPAVSSEAPMTPDYVGNPSQGSSSALIVVGIILVLLIGIGIGAIIYFRSQSAKPESQKIAGGDHSPDVAGDTYLQSLNLASYPGSTAAAVANDTGENVIAAFRTRDTPQQVIGYYKIRFPVADVVGQEGQSELRAALPDGEHVVIRAIQGQNGTSVLIIRKT